MRTTLARCETTESASASNRNIVRTYIVDNLLLGQSYGLSDTQSFYESGVLDSTAVMELVSFVEERFNIEIRDADMTEANFGSIAGIERLIAAKIAGQEPSGSELRDSAEAPHA